MKLKPGLFQLIVTVMTVSLLASCTTTLETNQSYCDNQQQTAQQPNDCDDDDSDSHSSTRYRSGSHRSRYGSSSKDSNSSRSKVGRGGFGSFGRGGRGGG